MTSPRRVHADTPADTIDVGRRLGDVLALVPRHVIAMLPTGAIDMLIAKLMERGRTIAYAGVALIVRIRFDMVHADDAHPIGRFGH